MTKPLNIQLTSQKQIHQEGQTAPPKPASVGNRKVDFFIPEIQLEGLDSLQHDNSKSVQQIVDRINQYIENIADDYFLLGLHMIGLHTLLRHSKMNTAQIKGWYAENVNMPYSSAMQCRKVAEIYQENPSLIQHYTPSGAYLLTSFSTPEEREGIWNEARGTKEAPSIRDLREVIRRRKDAEWFPAAPLTNTPVAYRMSTEKIHESFRELVKWSKQLLNVVDEIESEELRHILIRSCKHLIREMQEKVSE